MSSALRIVSVCVVAGLAAAPDMACAQSVKPAIIDDAAAQQDIAPPLPRLTVAPDEEQLAQPKRKRVVNPYAPQGIRQGGITYFPSLAIDAVGTSNAPKSASDAKSAIGLHLKPSLRFESDWVRHSWAGQASGDITSYAEKDTTGTRAIDASSRFRLDIRRDTRAEFAASYSLSQAGSENSEVPNTAIGNRTDQTLTASAAIIHDFGALQSQLKLGLERQIFDDVKLSGGGKEDNGDRNNFTPSLGLRLAYVDPPVFKPFAELVYAPRFHDQKRDRNGLARDSQGVTASLGVTLDRGPIWSGEAAIVYAVRDYKDNALATNSAFGINGNLTWKPTELTSVVLTLGTTLGESSSATSSGSKTYSGRMDVTHAMRDNINLLAGFGLSTSKFPGSSDDTITSKLGMEWQINPDLAWTASYDGTWFKGTTSAENYNEQRITTGFVLRR